MEPGPGVNTLWESCSGRKDNPRDVGLAEGQREGKRQTGEGGWLVQQEEIAFGMVKIEDAGREEGRSKG